MRQHFTVAGGGEMSAGLFALPELGLVIKNDSGELF